MKIQAVITIALVFALFWWNKPMHETETEVSDEEGETQNRGKG